MVEVNQFRAREVIEKPGQPKFSAQTTAKDYRSWLQGRINTCAKRNLAQEEFFFRECLNAYNHFEPLIESQVEVKGWKGKSSIELIKSLDRLTIIKFQKKDQFSEPTEIRIEVTKGELISLLDSLKFLQNRLKDKEYLETREIAFQFCLNQGIRETDKGIKLFEGDFWNNFFSWRSAHNKLTLMLDALRELRLIDYRAGKIKLLKDISIQMIL